MKKSNKRILVAAALSGLVLTSSMVLVGCTSEGTQTKLTQQEAYNLCVLAENKLNFNANNVADNLQINMTYQNELAGEESTGVICYTPNFSTYDTPVFYFSSNTGGNEEYEIIYKHNGKILHNTTFWTDATVHSYDNFITAYNASSDFTMISVQNFEAEDILNVKTKNNNTKITLVKESENTYTKKYMEITINEDGLIVEKSMYLISFNDSYSSYANYDMKYNYGTIDDSIKDDMTIAILETNLKYNSQS